MSKAEEARKAREERVAKSKAAEAAAPAAKPAPKPRVVAPAPEAAAKTDGEDSAFDQAPAPAVAAKPPLLRPGRAPLIRRPGERQFAKIGATTIPEGGLEVAQVKFAASARVCWRQTPTLNARHENASMVLIGALLWISKQNETNGKRQRGVWAVPVTNIVEITFPEERD